MQQETVTLLVAGLGIAGTLTSGPLTQYFARRVVHEQWERDKRTAIYSSHLFVRRDWNFEKWIFQKYRSRLTMKFRIFRPASSSNVFE
jgi:hypothetical protein